MNRFKTAVICLLLAVLLIQPVIPSVGAADSSPQSPAAAVPLEKGDYAATGDRLGITVKYNSSDMSVELSWNAISGASGYHIYLFNDDEDGNWFIDNSQSVDAGVTSKNYDKYFFTRHSSGGMNYKFRVTAYLPDHQSFDEEKTFQTGIPILDDPEGTLLPNGVFMLTKYSNKAKSTTVHLKDQNGKSVSFVSGGIGSGIQDFSSAITPGNYYYAHFDVSAEGYRYSQWVDTQQVRMRSDLMPVKSLKWNDYELSWKAYSTDPQTKYYYKLQQLSENSKEWFDRGDFEITTSTSQDFSSVLSKLPKATYRVVIFAVPGNGTPPSEVTISPELIYPLSYLTSAECTVDLPVGGANPDYTATPVRPPAFLNAPFTAEVWYWYLDESPYPHLSQTDTFTAGKNYAVRVTFTPEPGYAFNSDTVVKINGKAAVYVGASTYEATFTASSGDTANVYGTVVSFLEPNDDVTVELFKLLSADSYSTTVKGNSTTFLIPNVKKGTYFYSISKKNHVTRVDSYTAGSMMLFYVKINPIGDIDGDGDVTTFDYAQAMAHAKGVRTLSGYEFSCGNVAGDDSEITTIDAAAINAHAKGVKSLWQE